MLRVLSEKNLFFLNKAFADCKCIPDVYEPKKCIPKSRKVIWKEENNTMFKLWQRGKEIRSDCSNKKRTHHQTELTFKMRLLLIATSVALAAVSDVLETQFLSTLDKLPSSKYNTRPPHTARTVKSGVQLKGGISPNSNQNCQRYKLSFLTTNAKSCWTETLGLRVRKSSKMTFRYTWLWFVLHSWTT